MFKITKIYQTEFGKGRGNCTTAALASFFSMKMEEVPDVYSMPKEEWRDNIIDFFRSNGFELVYDTVPPEESDTEYFPIYFVEGISSRGCRHIIIERDGKLLHDPHPDGDGLITKDVWWLLNKI